MAQEPTRKELRKEKKEVRKEKKAAKKASSLRYMMLGMGVSYHNLQDLQMSNGRYSGPGLFTEWRRWEIMPKGKHDYVWARVGAGQTTAFHEGAQTQVIQPEFRYAYTRNLARWGTEERNIIRLGGYVSMMGNFRINSSLGNSAFHFDIMPNIGPAVDMDMPFTLPWVKTKCIFNYQLYSSIFAFNNSLPAYSLSGGALANDFLIFGRHGRLVSEASLIIPIRKNNANMFKLTYHWELLGYRDSEIFNARLGQHNLNFTLMVNLHSSNSQTNIKR